MKLQQHVIVVVFVFLALLVATAAVRSLWFGHHVLGSDSSAIGTRPDLPTGGESRQPTEAPYLRLLFQESPGYQERRQVTYSSQGEFRPGSLIHMDEGAPLSMVLAMEGALLVTSFQSGEGSFAAYVRGDNPLRISVSFNDKSSAVVAHDLEAKLKQGFIVEGDRTGKLMQLKFPRGFDDLFVGVAKSLAASFQLVVTAPLTMSWQSEESDAIGLAKTEYQFLIDANETVIQKSKVSYKSVYAQGAGQVTGKVSGSTRFFIDKTAGVISRVRGDEAATTYLANGEQIGTHRSEFSFTVIDRVHLGDVPLQSLQKLLATTFAGATVLAFAAPLPRSVNNDQIYRDVLGDTSYAELMAELKRGAQAATSSAPGKSPIDTYLKLKAFIALRSGALGRLVTDIYPYDVNSLEVSSWLRALSAVGNAEAQKTLLDMLAKVPKDNSEAKSAIINALALLPRADVSVEAAIRDLMVHAVDPEVRRVAYLALGIIGNRLITSSSAMDSPPAAECTARVTAIYNDIQLKLASTQDIHEQQLLLGVLGNLGSPDAVDSLDMLRKTAVDSRVGASAVMALRLIPSDEVIPLLLDSLRSDASSEVKMAAVRALGYQEVSSSQLSDLKDLYGTTGDMALKNQILQRIGREKPRFGRFVTEFLQEVSRDPASGSLAPLADQMLGGKP